VTASQGLRSVNLGVFSDEKRTLQMKHKAQMNKPLYVLAAFDCSKPRLWVRITLGS